MESFLNERYPCSALSPENLLLRFSFPLSYESGISILGSQSSVIFLTKLKLTRRQMFLRMSLWAALTSSTKIKSWKSVSWSTITGLITAMGTMTFRNVCFFSREDRERFSWFQRKSSFWDMRDCLWLKLGINYCLFLRMNREIKTTVCFLCCFRWQTFYDMKRKRQWSSIDWDAILGLIHEWTFDWLEWTKGQTRWHEEGYVISRYKSHES
jgi:hypothetical protein